MARPVIKPLKMADGAYVRTSLEELREHFDLPSVLGYYADGRLKEWLEYRYYKDEAEQLSQLKPNTDDFNSRLCELLGVVCPEGISVNMNAIAARNAKLVQLKQFTDSDEVIQNVDNVAFTQEEMTSLLDNNANLVYLCGKSFTVPLTKENVTYVGVNSPEVSIADTEAVDLQGKNINFEGVVFSGSHRKVWYETVIEKEIGINHNSVEDKKTNLIKSFTNIFGFSPGDTYAPRIKNALRIICRGLYCEDDIIYICDTSISSDGKSGLVLTTDAVCVKDAANFTSKFIAKYSDVLSTHIRYEKHWYDSFSVLELHMANGNINNISINQVNYVKLEAFINSTKSIL